MYSCIYCGWPVNNKPGQVCNSKSCGDKEMIKYPKTRQFKDCVFQVRKDSEYHGKPIPKLTFNGTVKLHGSNSSVVFNGGDIEFQSRNRIITPEDDNLGFAKFAEEIHWNEFFYTLLGDHNRYSKAVVYGEWCGEGIQSGIAISKAPKMFVIFAIKISDEWVPLDSVRRADVDSRVKWIDDFPTYTTIIDFNEVESAINSLVDITAQVEESCPVGRQLGFEGIGEGVVWVCESNLDLRFKVKGEKHSNSKVKKLNPVDAERIERLKTLMTLSTVKDSKVLPYNYG